MELSKATQEKLGVLADWDVYILEPLKRIPMEDIRNDMEEHGEKSDFFGLKSQIRVIIMNCIYMLGNA